MYNRVCAPASNLKFKNPPSFFLSLNLSFSNKVFQISLFTNRRKYKFEFSNLLLGEKVFYSVCEHFHVTSLFLPSPQTEKSLKQFRIFYRSEFNKIFKKLSNFSELHFAPVEEVWEINWKKRSWILYFGEILSLQKIESSIIYWEFFILRLRLRLQYLDGCEHFATFPQKLFGQLRKMIFDGWWQKFYCNK